MSRLRQRRILNPLRHTDTSKNLLEKVRNEDSDCATVIKLKPGGGGGLLVQRQPGIDDAKMLPALDVSKVLFSEASTLSCSLPGRRYSERIQRGPRGCEAGAALSGDMDIYSPSSCRPVPELVLPSASSSELLSVPVISAQLLGGGEKAKRWGNLGLRGTPCSQKPGSTATRDGDCRKLSLRWIERCAKIWGI